MDYLGRCYKVIKICQLQRTTKLGSHTAQFPPCFIRRGGFLLLNQKVKSAGAGSTDKFIAVLKHIATRTCGQNSQQLLLPLSPIYRVQFNHGTVCNCPFWCVLYPMKRSVMSALGASGDTVLLATASYDHTIRFWQAHSGICHRTVQHQDSVSFSS